LLSATGVPVALVIRVDRIAPVRGQRFVHTFSSSRPGCGILSPVHRWRGRAAALFELWGAANTRSETRVATLELRGTAKYFSSL